MYIKKIKFLFFAMSITLIMGCVEETKIVNRIKSPDQKVEAVIVEKNSGATSAYSYSLYLVKPGDSPKKGSELLIVDQVGGIEVNWRRNNFLEIPFGKGRIFHFRNQWSTKEIENFKYIVELRLVYSGET